MKYSDKPELLPFVFLIATSAALRERENLTLTIKKCCPKNQQLNPTLICINATGDPDNNKPNNTQYIGDADDPSKIFFPDFYDNYVENNSSSFAGLLPWFPFTSLINADTLQQITDFRSMRDSLRDATLEYGVHPDCTLEEKDWSCFRPRHSEQFRLVLYPGQDIKLYVAKKSSNHDQQQFKAEDRDCDFVKIGSSENSAKAKGRNWYFLLRVLSIFERRPEEMGSIQGEKLKFPSLENGGDWVEKWLLNVSELRTFPSGDFCVDRGPRGSFLAEYCPCKTVPCLRKCCRDSEVFDDRNEKCVSNSTFGFWRPSLENSSLPRDYYLLSNRYPSSCKNPHWLKIPLSAYLNIEKSCGNRQRNQEEREKFYFFPDGSLKVKRYKMNIPPQSYCGDHMIYDSENFVENNIFMCLDEESSLPKFRIYGTLFVIGGIVLLVTIAISLYLPELRSSVYNKVIICHNVSLMLADFIWGSTYLLPYLTHKLCIFLSLAIQCTFLGSFFWMNVMCLDISIGIRRLKSARVTIDDNHKFLWYLIYACGGPVIITSITAAMEFAPSLPPYLIRPGFGCYNCGFNPDSPSILIYVYGPMIAIIFLNLVFFLMTVIQIIKIQKQTAILDNQMSSMSTINTGKKRLVIFGKLFLLMGLSWITEIIGWLAGGKEYYWYLPDFVNILRAVFIFALTVCKKKVLRSLITKLKGFPERNESRRNTTAETEFAEIKGREKLWRKQDTEAVG